MKAKFEPRIDLANRRKLEEVIPLNSPFVVFVDPSDACNFKCRFCPTSDRQLMKEVSRPWKQMSFDLFKKIANDLKCFSPKVEVLRLYKDGEPLLNKRLADMIKYAKDNASASRIDTTTNAALLTSEKGRDIVNAGLDRINISIYGVSNENYTNFSGVKLEFERVLSNVREFYEIKAGCEMLVKINGDSLTDREKEIFLEEFGDFTDKIFIEHTMSCWPEFKLRGVEVNTEKGIYGQSIQEVSVCPYPFYGMAVNSDGLVSLCFLDWGRKLSIGNVNVSTLTEIWESQEMRSYRLMFLSGNRKQHPVCGNCGQMSHGRPDNIDAHADFLKTKLQRAGYFNGINEPTIQRSYNKSIGISLTK